MISWWEKDDYNYCYLVPPVVLYLIWEKRNLLASLPSVSSWKGLMPFVLGIALFWLGELGGEHFTLYISFWLVVVGLCWMHFGWNKLKTIGFALILILSMFPLPRFLYHKFSVKLKLLSSQLSVAFMHIYGMSAYREGNIIDLGIAKLQVIDACSGLRYLIPLIILGILLAYFFKVALWKRTLLVISTVPLSIITNSLRIALTGILYETWGPWVAEGFFHEFSGWFIFMFSLCLLLLEMWILKKIGGVRLEAEGKKKKDDDQPPTLSGVLLQPQTTKGFMDFVHPPQFIVAVVLLGVTLVLSQSIEFREKIPIKKSFEHFPLQVGEWTGICQSMDQRSIDNLNLSDYVIIDFQDKLGKSVNFYVAYYESQSNGGGIHSPGTCLPSSGWIFNEAGEVTISLQANNGGFMKANRVFMQKNLHKQLCYYWFPQRGRILTNVYQLKIFAFWDALTKQRTNGALVRVITSVYEFEELKDAEERLQIFTREIVPVLSEFIPA